MRWYRVTIEVEVPVETPVADPAISAAIAGWTHLQGDGMPVVLVQELTDFGGTPLDNQKQLIDLAVDGDRQIQCLSPQERAAKRRSSNNEEI